MKHDSWKLEICFAVCFSFGVWILFEVFLFYDGFPWPVWEHQRNIGDAKWGEVIIRGRTDPWDLDLKHIISFNSTHINAIDVYYSFKYVFV